MCKKYRRYMMNLRYSEMMRNKNTDTYFCMDIFIVEKN